MYNHDFVDDSSEGEPEVEPAGSCFWHRGCRLACMNTVPMCMFTEAGYVFRCGNVYETDDFSFSWGLDCGLWPLDAVPVYRLVVGEYLLGQAAGQEHVMYTLDRCGCIRVPRNSCAGDSSWIHWHALYDAGTRLSSAVDLARAADLRAASIGARVASVETSLDSDLFVHAPPTMSLRAPLLPPQPSQARGEASDGPLIREAREIVGKQRNDACTRMYGLTARSAVAACCVVEPRPLKRVRVARGGE